MNVLDAANATVKAYPGGAEALAVRMDMPPALLRAKVNPNQERNHLTLEEADLMMAVSGDYRILYALGAEHSHALQRLAPAEESTSVVQSLLDLNVAEGELARTIHDAFADQVISDREMRAIAAAGHENQAALIGLINRLRAAKAGQAA